MKSMNKILENFMVELSDYISGRVPEKKNVMARTEWWYDMRCDYKIAKRDTRLNINYQWASELFFQSINIRLIKIIYSLYNFVKKISPKSAKSISNFTRYVFRN